MATQDFTTTISVEQTPGEVFDAINNVRGWWSKQINGSTNEAGAVFDYHYKDVHICKMKIIEFIPGKKVVWLVLENYFDFVKDKTEWKNTNVVFEIFEKDDKTLLCFTHVGLVPEYECFDICKTAWTRYIEESLFNLITTGEGQPNPIEEVVREASLKAAKL